MRPLFFAAHLCLFVKMWDCVEFCGTACAKCLKTRMDAEKQPCAFKHIPTEVR